MRNFIVVLMAVIALAGCQKREEAKGGTNERQVIAQKLISKSLQELQNKDLKGAVNSLEASIQANPSAPEAYLLMGQIMLNVNEYQKAVEFLDRAVKACPENGNILYMMSIANRMVGNKLPAVLAARRSAELFQAQGDKDNFIKAAVLLQDLINTPDDVFGDTVKSEEIKKPSTKE